MMNLVNRVDEFEFDICAILAKLAYHIHPRIVERIQSRNRQEYGYFKDLFAGKIEVDNYLFDGSACVFPGVRRYVAGRGKLLRYNPRYHAIIDDNTFPRYIWTYLANGIGYSSHSWRKTGLNQFELAHVFTHKASELAFEETFFDSVRADVRPHSDFTCACNVVLLPKGTVRPTDNSAAIKTAFYMRYLALYGEAPLIGRSGFRTEYVPSWYGNLQWNEPWLPEKWRENIERLLEYRTRRITHIMSRAE